MSPGTGDSGRLGEAFRQAPHRNRSQTQVWTDFIPGSQAGGWEGCSDSGDTAEPARVLRKGRRRR